MKGVLVWNTAEKSWDCPGCGNNLTEFITPFLLFLQSKFNDRLFEVHGSRFDGVTGRCVMGPSNCDLHPENELAKELKLAEMTSSGSGAASLLAGGAGTRSAERQVDNGWDSLEPSS